MGKKVKLYSCKAIVTGEEDIIPSMNYSNVVREYIFAKTKDDATNLFTNRHPNNFYITVSEVNMTPGLVIYKNKYNYTIEDNELTLNAERSDKHGKSK